MENLLVDLKTGQKIKVKVGELTFGGEEKIIISGPCSVEEFKVMEKITRALKEKGVHMLRGGAFKPRTSPYDFQGLGFEGFKILKALREEFNMPVVSEVLDTRHVEKALDYIDMIQIGSRNMYNYSLLKEVGKTNKPVLLKRGMSATLNEWLNAAEYIMSEGNNNVVLCERGIRTFENYTRNTLDLNSVAVIKEKYRLPVIVDPSHGTGLRDIVPIMSMAAIASGADGIMVESHIDPEHSISDSHETVSLETIGNIVENIRKGRLF